MDFSFWAAGASPSPYGCYIKPSPKGWLRTTGAYGMLPYVEEDDVATVERREQGLALARSHFGDTSSVSPWLTPSPAGEGEEAAGASPRPTVEIWTREGVPYNTLHIFL